MTGRRMGIAMAAGLFSLSAAAAGPVDDPLAGLQWRSRVLLVIADAPSDPRLTRQRAAFQSMGAGARERDLELVEAIGATPKAAALRKRFALGTGFHAILIGKDGGDKLTSDEPLGADTLFPLIDAMPMRQEEMRRRS